MGSIGITGRGLSGKCKAGRRCEGERSWVRLIRELGASVGGGGGRRGGVQSDKRNTAHNQHVPTLSLLEILVMAKKVECTDDIFNNRQATPVCFDSKIFMKTVQ